MLRLLRLNPRARTMVAYQKERLTIYTCEHLPSSPLTCWTILRWLLRLWRLCYHCATTALSSELWDFNSFTNVRGDGSLQKCRWSERLFSSPNFAWHFGQTGYFFSRRTCPFLTPLGIIVSPVVASSRRSSRPTSSLDLS